jgi:hypothetical protein
MRVFQTMHKGKRKSGGLTKRSRSRPANKAGTALRIGFVSGKAPEVQRSIARSEALRNSGGSKENPQTPEEG